MVLVNTPIGVVIEESIIGDFVISHKDNTLFLHQNDMQLMCLNTKYYCELYDQQAFYDLAYGKVLLSGFGFGLAPAWLAQKPEVTEVWVIEPHLETVKLFMRNNIMSPKIRIIHGSVFDYSGDTDCLFLDHFPDLALDNLMPQVLQIGNNIQHKIGWYYSVELQYLRDMYSFNVERIMQNATLLNGYDIMSKWQEFQQLHTTFSLPDIDDKTLRNYINNFSTTHYL